MDYSSPLFPEGLLIWVSSFVTSPHIYKQQTELCNITRAVSSRSITALNDWFELLIRRLLNNYWIHPVILLDWILQWFKYAVWTTNIIWPVRQWNIVKYMGKLTRDLRATRKAPVMRVWLPQIPYQHPDLDYFLKQHQSNGICNGEVLCFLWVGDGIFKYYLDELRLQRVKWCVFKEPYFVQPTYFPYRVACIYLS
jgi:hypothetical protein